MRIAANRLVAASALAICAGAAHAGVSIEFTGMNLTYDGSAFYDSGSNAGGIADPADADQLATVDFFNNGALVGSLDSDIWLDVFIPGITNIPSAANTTYSQNTPGAPGFFDLLIGSSPLASEFLILDIGSVSITYVDAAGLAQFTFGAAISENSAQNLPFGLVMTDPITISFSAQVLQGTKTAAGGFITGFEAFGTGEFAEAIPTPASALALAGFGALGLRRRRSA